MGCVASSLHGAMGPRGHCSGHTAPSQNRSLWGAPLGLLKPVMPLLLAPWEARVAQSTVFATANIICNAYLRLSASKAVILILTTMAHVLACWEPRSNSTALAH